MIELKTRLVDMGRNWKTGKVNITFEVDTDDPTGVLEYMETIKDKIIKLAAKVWREKRSLDANAYYWVLIGKLAERQGISQAYCHNKMLRQYGQLEYIDGQLVYLIIPDTDDAERKAQEAETFHIRPTTQTKEGVDGVMYRTYVMLRGSHTYNTYEFSVLINGLIAECKDEGGIETLTPNELEKMLYLYEVNYAKKNKITE